MPPAERARPSGFRLAGCASSDVRREESRDACERRSCAMPALRRHAERRPGGGLLARVLGRGHATVPRAACGQQARLRVSAHARSSGGDVSSGAGWPNLPASNVRGLLQGHSSTEQVAQEREDVRAVVVSRLMKPTDQDGGDICSCKNSERSLAVVDKCVRARLRACYARGACERRPTGTRRHESASAGCPSWGATRSTAPAPRQARRAGPPPLI